MSNVTNTLLPPFAITTLPQYMRYELRRRSGYVNKDKNITGNYGFDINYKEQNFQNFKGPKAVWLRVCSNAIVKDRVGLVLYGGTSFDDAYGFDSKNPQDGKQIIGYEPTTGKPHYLLSSNIRQPYRPIPGITNVEVLIRKSIYRAAKISWRCYSIDQMNYLANYMFTPYTTMVVEWGWDTFYKESLLPLSDSGQAAIFDKNQPNKANFEGSGIIGAYTNPKLIEDRIEWSQGNYDAMIGHITNFNYSFDQANNAFNCVTELASNSKYYFSLATANLTNYTSKSGEKETAVDVVSLSSYFKNDFHGKIKESLSKPDTNISAMNSAGGRQPVLSENRVFSFSHFIGSRAGDLKYKDKYYITFDLFIDILNSFIATKIQNGKVEGIMINIKGVRVGAHPNMISPCLDFLIPNAAAPFIPSVCLSTKVNSANLGSSSIINIFFIICRY
jgi:hypothetical protein